VGDSCPSFPEPNSAWRAFFEGDCSLAGAQNPPTDLAVLRVVQDAGRLGHVRVTATQLTVEVNGTSLEGCELELFGVTGRASQRISSAGEVTFSLDRGLPEHAWLWLKNGTSWLDYRSIDPGSVWTGDLARAGVNIDVPSDPQANLEALLAAGEGPQLEYKRQLPADTAHKRGMFKTVAAFAIGDGGTMVFGIDPDELTVTGLDSEDPKELRDHLYDLVHRTVIPSPDVTVEGTRWMERRSWCSMWHQDLCRRTGSPRTKAPGTSPSSTCAGGQAPIPPNPANYAKQPATVPRSTRTLAA
jgi:hypothetical protein